MKDREAVSFQPGLEEYVGYQKSVRKKSISGKG